MHCSWMLLKLEMKNRERGTGNEERGTGNGERGTGNRTLGTNVQRSTVIDLKSSSFSSKMLFRVETFENGAQSSQNGQQKRRLFNRSYQCPWTMSEKRRQ